MSKLETIKITREIKEAMTDFFTNTGYTKYAIEANKLKVNDEFTMFEYFELLRVLSWHDVPEVLKPIKSIVKNQLKYMIYFNHTKLSKQQDRLENILFNLCEKKIIWNDASFWFIPSKKECENIVQYLGELIALEPDLPYQFYCTRKEAFKILRRLMKEEQ